MISVRDQTLRSPAQSQSPDLPSLIFIPVGCRLVPGAWCGDTACSGTGLGSPGGQETLDTLMQRCASFMANGQLDMLISNITPRTNGEIRRTLVLPQDKRHNVILIED